MLYNFIPKTQQWSESPRALPLVFTVRTGQIKLIMCLALRYCSLTGRSSTEVMNEMFLQGPGECTDHSALTGTGTGCSETENLGSCHSSHHLCWASAPFRGHVTGAETVPSESALLLRAATTTHSSKENCLPLMLYCTKKPNTSHTHRMSADCYFMCHVTLIFLEMISRYLEEKKLCDSVVRNCSELNRKYLWMEI